MQERIEELEAKKETSNEISDDVSLLEGDSLSKVLGPERNGRVFGVTPKMFKNDNIKLVQELQKANEENTHLKGNFETLHEEHQDLKEKYAELKDQILELKAALSHSDHGPTSSHVNKVFSNFLFFSILDLTKYKSKIYMYQI